MTIQKFYRLFLPLFCLALMLTLTIGSAQASPIQQTDADFAAIDAYVAEQVRVQGIPGLGLGILQDGQIAHLQGFGVADSSGRAVTPQTPFYIGSVTKSFTALAVMQLVEAGKIDLDAPVQTYLPWFELADKEASAQITVRNLLNHTSGISEVDGNRYWPSQTDLEETVRGFNSLSITQPVGSTFQYANINFGIAGLIVEVVSGQTYGDYVAEHIFEPLDMRHSYTSRLSAQADGLAEGHHYMFGRTFSDDGASPPIYLPTGFLIASVEDLSHYAVAQLNEGRYGDTSVLSLQGITDLHTPAIAAGEANQYALGWYIGEIDGNRAVWHQGDTSRFHSVVLLMPERGLGIVLLANVSGFIQLETQVANIALGIFNLLNGETASPVSLPFLMGFFYWTILLTPVLQILGIVFTWKKHLRMNAWGVALTVILNLAVVYVVLRFSQIRMLLPSLVVYFPELGYTAIIAAILGVGWSVIYTAAFMMRRRAS